MSVLVNQPAPDFTATAIMADNSIKEDFKLSDYKGKYVVLFFYPLDFTFVCPSEILAFDHRLQQFKDHDAQVIGVSVDSPYTHLAWKNTPVEDGGIGKIQYPLVSDLTKSIARSYDVLLDNSIALRGTFIIDRSGKVQHQVVNNLPLGRNVDEALRILDAIQYNEQFGEVCPANWQKGAEGMKATPEGVAEYLAVHGHEL